MSILDQDIDKQIQQHQQRILELEQLKKDHEKKLEGLKEFDLAIKRLCNQNSLTEAELYVSRSEQIEAWLVEMSRQESPSSIYNNLKKHFDRAQARGGKREKKSTLPKPKLAVGVYRNPATQEKVEKIKRNPRQLDQWIAEYGFETVRTWKE
ncbi:hypothetical protein [Parathalassolituus penaei]|uniref:Transcriptional regulator n=1 Tax=Parathalassolituus penaei TaxID=2997323 RepID=A0A9X3EGM0_9GAMM|nr:hypothetical protein [Parathalassolituus penaei]MCY0967182.1 hypothetical protein [Parathalassolituus penaei]